MSKLTRITINGCEYENVEQMPPDVREQYEQAMAALEKEDVFKMLGLGKKGVTQTTKTAVQETITYNGREYAGRDELPPEVRALLEKVPPPSPVAPMTDVKIETVQTIPSEQFIIKSSENRERAPERDPKVAWLLVSILTLVVVALLFLLYLARHH